MRARKIKLYIDMSFWDGKLKVIQLLIISNTTFNQLINLAGFTMYYVAVAYGVKWIKEKRKCMWCPSLMEKKRFRQKRTTQIRRMKKEGWWNEIQLNCRRER